MARVLAPKENQAILAQFGPCEFGVDPDNRRPVERFADPGELAVDPVGSVSRPLPCEANVSPLLPPWVVQLSGLLSNVRGEMD
jgi:hypothetical protein